MFAIVIITNQTFFEALLCAAGNECKEIDISKHKPHRVRGLAWSEEREGLLCPRRDREEGQGKASAGWLVRWDIGAGWVQMDRRPHAGPSLSMAGSRCLGSSSAI